MSKKISFITLGCKVNQYDSQAMLELFQEQGYAVASPSESADVYVVNTCTVTGTGDQKSRQLIRRCLRKNPDANLVIAGCLAQQRGEELRESGARLIIGTQYRGQVVELLEKAIAEDTQIVAVEALESVPYEPLTIRRHEGHTRAVMKIQEGCDRHCTYCIIPSVRGNVRSRDLNSIQREAAELAKAGFQEIVLTGIHLTSYGRDLPGRPSLMDAAREICAQDGIARVRLGSLEPCAVNDAFVSAAAAMPKLCPQFHLALQSGSDNVLRQMKRSYTTEQFLAGVQRLREVFPHAAFTTDVIVGFPGETEADFAQTLAFCEKVGFAKIHVFPYSKREGTPAASMPMQVPKAEKDRRVHALMALGEVLSENYRRSMLGEIREVLLEEALPSGQWEGYTPEYIHTVVSAGQSGQRAMVRLSELTKEGMTGMIVES